MILGSNGYIGRNLTARLPDTRTVINCSGMKSIVICQHRPTEAYTSNAIHAGTFSHLYRDSKFIHISSDHAYCAGNQSTTVYAKSKRLGDELVMAENPNATVIVTGHVYAPNCPWIVWLDGELKAGRQVVAYTNRVCSPTWIGDLADACRDPKPGLMFVLGRQRVNRVELYRAYARAFGYDDNLIMPGLETNPLLIGDSSHASDVHTKDLYEGFAAMRAEMTAYEDEVKS